MSLWLCFSVERETWSFMFPFWMKTKAFIKERSPHASRHTCPIMHLGSVVSCCFVASWLLCGRVRPLLGPDLSHTISFLCLPLSSHDCDVDLCIHSQSEITDLIMLTVYSPFREYKRMLMWAYMGKGKIEEAITDLLFYVPRSICYAVQV